MGTVAYVIGCIGFLLLVVPLLVFVVATLFIGEVEVKKDE